MFVNGSNKIATSYKRGAAKSTLIMCGFLLVIIIYVLITTPELQSEEKVIGKVIAVHPMQDDSQQYGWFIEIELENQKRTRLLMNKQPIPDVGDRIPLIKETYDNGEVLINLSSEFLLNRP